MPSPYGVLEDSDIQLGPEDLSLGQRFSNQDCMAVPMWPFTDKVMWLRPPKDMQVGTGYYTTKAVQFQSYHMVLKFSGKKQCGKGYDARGHCGDLDQQLRPPTLH